MVFDVARVPVVASCLSVDVNLVDFGASVVSRLSPKKKKGIRVSPNYM